MNTTKFKVGDRVRYMHPNHHTGTIILINNFINIKRDDGLRGCGWQGSWTGDEESYKLIAPSPLKNTIITDIKDGAQHRRIQEKLFRMDQAQYLELSGVPGCFKGPSFGNSMRDKLIKQFKKYNYNTPTTPSSVKGKNIMNNITNFFNDLNVSKDDKELRKAGLKNDELQWTDEAINVVRDLEAVERGYKSFDALTAKINSCSSGRVTVLEADTLFTKFYAKLLENAIKFNKANK